MDILYTGTIELNDKTKIGTSNDLTSGDSKTFYLGHGQVVHLSVFNNHAEVRQSIAIGFPDDHPPRLVKTIGSEEGQLTTANIEGSSGETFVNIMSIPS